MESNDTDLQTDETTTVEMAADKYERNAYVAEDGRLWMGDDWAGEEIEIAARKKAE